MLVHSLKATSCRNVAAFLLLLPLGKYLSIQAKIVVPFAISALVVLIQAWVAYSTHLSGNMVIVTTLLSSALLGFVTAAMTSATYALATFLPGAYIQVRADPPFLNLMTSAFLSGIAWLKT